MWAEAQVPYKPPAQGEVQEQFVDLFKASKGDRVKIAQGWVGHYPTLKQVHGTLGNRSGRGWAVRFDGCPQEMFFDVQAEMRQLVHATTAPLAPEEEERAANAVQAEAALKIQTRQRGVRDRKAVQQAKAEGRLPGQQRTGA